jgi:hypothetical protein
LVLQRQCSGDMIEVLNSVEAKAAVTVAPRSGNHH